MPNQPARLNDLTHEQIQAIRAELEARKGKEDKHCLWCEAKRLMRADQKFCSASCRAQYAQAAARAQYETLCREKEAWALEREELVREIAALRARLGES